MGGGSGKVPDSTDGSERAGTKAGTLLVRMGQQNTRAVTRLMSGAWQIGLDSLAGDPSVCPCEAAGKSPAGGPSD